MATLGTYALDGYGNNLVVGYDILGQENNSTTYQRYIGLNVVAGGSVSWSSPRASFNNPSASASGLPTYYGPGYHTLLLQQVTVQHDSSGHHTETISGNVRVVANWDFSFDVDFPPTKQPATINNFTGESIYGTFKASYTPVSGQNYTYKLRISIPNVVALALYENYSSNSGVTLSSTAINAIKNYTSADRVDIGGVIETFEGSTKIGESNEIIISCSTKEQSKARVRVNGAWKEATVYVRINGVWKEAKPYIRVNNQWKEGI